MRRWTGPDVKKVDFSLDLPFELTAALLPGILKRIGHQGEVQCDTSDSYVIRSGAEDGQEHQATKITVKLTRRGARWTGVEIQASVPRSRFRWHPGRGVAVELAELLHASADNDVSGR